MKFFITLKFFLRFLRRIYKFKFLVLNIWLIKNLSHLILIKQNLPWQSFLRILKIFKLLSTTFYTQLRKVYTTLSKWGSPRKRASHYKVCFLVALWILQMILFTTFIMSFDSSSWSYTSKITDGYFIVSSRQVILFKIIWKLFWCPILEK